ncbi:hypothetical protein MNBD_IGNAVI01-2123, partial [hydrothermal vent metagenome]
MRQVTIIIMIWGYLLNALITEPIDWRACPLIFKAGRTWLGLP